MNRALRTSIACTILAIASGGAAKAQVNVLYSTIPAGYVNEALSSDVAPDSGLCDYSACDGVGWTVFDRFSLSKNANSIDLSVYNYVSGTGPVSVNWSIWTSNNGAPGVEIGSEAQSPAVLTRYVPPHGSDQPGASLVKVAGVSANVPNQALIADTTYFLGFEVIVNSGDSADYATTGLGPPAYRGVSSPQFSDPRYTQLALYIVGAGSGGPTPGIPEPSTWAMLAVGFAGLGWTASRRFARATLRRGTPADTISRAGPAAGPRR